MAIRRGKYIPEVPSADQRIHPRDVYTPAAHNANLELIKNYLGVLGESTGSNALVTSWMLTKGGVARVFSMKRGFVAEIAENDTRSEKDIFLQGLAIHYVKHRIVIDNEGYDGRKSNSRVYLPMHQRATILFMNKPVSAGMMMGFPTVHYNPGLASELLNENLSNPQDQFVAHHEDLTGALATRPIHRIGWGQIQLETS
jgi:hypothetical protein